jgi:hypothetical protein
MTRIRTVGHTLDFHHHLDSHIRTSPCFNPRSTCTACPAVLTDPFQATGRPGFLPSATTCTTRG